MTQVTCRLTAKNWDQLPEPTLGNRVWATFTFRDCVSRLPYHFQDTASYLSRFAISVVSRVFNTLIGDVILEFY